MKRCSRFVWSCIALVMAALCLMVHTYLSGRIYATGTEAVPESYLSIQTEEGVREIGFEEYVMGITAKQISADANEQARRAQMVLARTNLRAQMEKEPETLPSFAYRTAAELEREGTLEIFQGDSQATAGQVLKVDGGLAYLPYHRVSAGMTRAGKEALPGMGYDWLTSKDCSSDLESSDYLGIFLFSPEEFGEKLDAAWPGALEEGKDVKGQVQAAERDSADYVLSVQVGTRKVTGEEFSKAMGLYSPCFYIEEAEDKIRITTKGMGHGLGLSQFQAELMGEAGAGYGDILAAFFEGGSLETL